MLTMFVLIALKDALNVMDYNVVLVLMATIYQILNAYNVKETVLHAKDKPLFVLLVINKALIN